MPAALDVNREEVRMLALNVGVREAARQMDIPEATVQAWAARYGWLKNAPRSVPLPSTVIRPRATNATKAVDCLVNTLLESVRETRANHVSVALKASRKLTELPAELLLDHDQAQTTLAIAKHAALTAGWNADSRPDAPGKAFGARNSGLTIDTDPIDAEVIAEASTDVNDY